MKQYWKKLEAYLQASNPALLSDLNPPASDAELRELEKQLGVALPADFIECLKIHNGQRGNAEWLFDGDEFLSTSNILMEWSAWNNLLRDGEFDARTTCPDDAIRGGWWRPNWIPFTSDGSGDHLCLDLDPSEKGSNGQVIKIFHDFSERKLKSSDFSAWFSHFVDTQV
jgi:cell wall assembly regulator SMI1